MCYSYYLSANDIIDYLNGDIELLMILNFVNILKFSCYLLYLYSPQVKLAYDYSIRHFFNSSIRSKFDGDKPNRLKVKNFNFPSLQTSTALTIWGVSMGSGLGGPRVLPEYLRSIYSLPHYHYSVVIGLILSDAWISGDRSGGGNARLGFKQSTIFFPYLWYVFNILSPFVASMPNQLHPVLRGKTYMACQFQTRKLKCFTELWERFYPVKVKIVPIDIYQDLNAIALAHLIQGDGYRRYKGLAICTDSFSLQEVHILLHAINFNFGLVCTIFQHNSDRGNIQYRIYIKPESMETLIKLVIPHMVPQMTSKLGLADDLTKKQKNKKE